MEVCLLARAEHHPAHSPDKPAVWVYAGGELEEKMENLWGRLAGCLLAGRESGNAAGLLRDKETLLNNAVSIWT